MEEEEEVEEEMREWGKRERAQQEEARVQELGGREVEESRRLCRRRFSRTGPRPLGLTTPVGSRWRWYGLLGRRQLSICRHRGRTHLRAGLVARGFLDQWGSPAPVMDAESLWVI